MSSECGLLETLEEYKSYFNVIGRHFDIALCSSYIIIISSHNFTSFRNYTN